MELEKNQTILTNSNFVVRKVFDCHDIPEFNGMSFLDAIAELFWEGKGNDTYVDWRIGTFSSESEGACQDYAKALDNWLVEQGCESSGGNLEVDYFYGEEVLIKHWW